MFTLDQAYEAVKGRTEFAIKESQDTVCFDYIIILNDSFNDSTHGWIRRNFRGITFCKKTSKVLSLPFHKFYNINQNEESQFIYHKHKKANIYEKLDGSMIHFYRKENGELVASTCRSSENIQSRDAMSFARSNFIYQINESIDAGLTPIFEWCSPENQIICYYGISRLVYLMSRCRSTGKYIYELKYADRSAVYEMPFSEIIDHRDKSEFEGYVCYLDDGNVFKVKTPWYLERHRIFDILNRPKYKICELALSNSIDDILSVSTDVCKKILIEVDDEVKNDLLNAKISLEEEFDAIVLQLADICVSDYRKNFAMIAKNSLNFPALMLLLSGKSPDPVIKKNLIQMYTKKYPSRAI